MSAYQRPAVLAAVMVVAVQSVSAQVPLATEFENLHFRSIGPASMSGRVADLAVYERNPAVYYVATAHGGLWKTTSNGAMFTPLFQNEGLISTGDVTISQRNPDLVWVGAGESNNRQSTSWGGGVYKSTDGGKTFQHMGLADSKHIHRIVIDPANDDIVLVAATGPLFGPGGDRGVYKTTDGGRSWKHVLRPDEDTGANDIVLSASEPRTLFATTYQRRRTACCMNGGGPGSGIWKSTDAGDTWTRLTGNGWPAGPLGRVAVDVYRKDGKIVYATAEGPGGGGGGGAAMNPAAGASPAPTGLYRSDDGGANWRKVSSNNPRPMYFSKLHIDPNNADRVYMGGVGLQMTIDGGKTFATDAALVIHDDIHSVWVNPANPDHILIGGDGGVAVSYDMSRTWTFLPNLPVGLFYHVSYDMETPFNVCGGMQDNYNWCGPSASRHNRGIFNYDWFQILGGDGFVAIPDLRDSRIIYTESQNGNMIRRNKVTGESRSIRPSPANVVNHKAGETYRYNWDSPMMLSPHDPGILLVAAERVFKSTDRGDSWTAISPDLTTNANRNDIVTMGLKNSETNIARNDGISFWPTLVSLAESPAQAGLYYTGSEDGVVSMSRDGGKNWQNITSRLPGFPAGGFVSEVVPSKHAAGTVYVTVANYRVNDYKTYIWASTDFGATFRSLNGNLSGEVVRTLTEDLKNPEVLYIGTETGIFLSLDRGRSWRRLKANLPTVRVDEITLHPRDNAMIVATHGRSLWILDHLSPIQDFSATQNASVAARLFTLPGALQWKSKDDRNDEFWGHQFFVGENPPADAVLPFYVKSSVNDLKLRITDAGGRAVRELVVPAAKRRPGIQTVCWDMRVEPILPDTTGRRPGGAPGGGAPGGGGPGGGGQGQNQQARIPGVPTQLPEAGYMPANPCVVARDTAAAPGGGGGGGGGGFGGGGGAAVGPHVVPGNYTVALIADGQTVDSKPLKVIADPAISMTVAQRTRYNTLAEELHALQRRGARSANALTQLGTQIGDVQSKIKDNTLIPANVKSDFDTFVKEFDKVRVKFGVPAARASGAPAGGPGGGGGGGGGGFGGGGAVDPANVYGRVTATKNNLLAFWEPPSAATVREHAEVSAALPRAVAEADSFLVRARAMAEALSKVSVTMVVPPRS